MATDPAARIAALTTTIARQAAILDSGITQTLENGRMVRLDLDTVRDQMNANVATLAALTGARPQVRRVYPTAMRRGY